MQAIKLLCLKQDLEFSHVRDEHAARTKDETWLPAFAADNGKAILSGDAAMLKRPNQIMAIHDAGLICFLLSSQWTWARLNRQVANIVWQWPKIEKALETVSQRECFLVPFTFDDKPLEIKKINYEAVKSIARN